MHYRIIDADYAHHACNNIINRILVDSYGVKRLYESTRFMLVLETSGSNEFNALIACAYIILNNPDVMKPLMVSMSAMSALETAVIDLNAGVNIRDFVKAI